MRHLEGGESLDWIVVFAPLIGVVILAGVGYFMGYLADRWRRK